MSAVVRYFAELGRGIVRGWDRFFFTPADPTPLGAIRVVAGLLATWNLLVYGMEFTALLGPEGLADPGTVVRMRPPGSSLWSFWDWLPPSAFLPAWWGALVALALFTLGLFSRVTAILAWAIVASTARRAAPFLFGFDQILSTLLLYLAATGASGQAISLDRFFGRWRQYRALARRKRASGPIAWQGTGVPAPSVSANLGLRLIQVHLCLIYGLSGMAKLQGEMWWGGTAVWPTWVDREFAIMDLSWLASYPLLINFATHMTVAVELSYPFLIWNRLLRPLLLGIVAAMHLGIGLTLGLNEFALAMLAMNLAFVDGAWLRSLVTGSGPPAKLLYDGACPRCRGSVAILAAADPGRIVEPVDLTAVDVRKVHPSLTPEACMAAMHLVSGDGKRAWPGYDAAAKLGRWFPLFWPFGLLTLVPGVAVVGRRAYNRIAAARPREVPCTDEVCGLPGAGSGEGGEPATAVRGARP